MFDLRKRNVVSRRVGTALKSLGVTVALAAAASTANAEVIFQETFASGTGQFTPSGRVYTGSYGARMRGGGGAASLTSAAISTTGFTNIRLSFNRTTSGLDLGENAVAAVSVNNGAFTTVESTRSASGRTTIQLPAAAADSSVRLRFSLTASSFYETYEVASIVVEGDGEDPGPDPGGEGPFPPTTGTPSCSNLLPGQFSCSLGGRTYSVYVPSSYTGVWAVPLVIDMHGYTSTNSAQQRISGWNTLANTQGFIVAYPQGQSNSWNAQGQCCGSASGDDVQFIRNVVADIRLHARISAPRIYATGLSNGGSMTHTLACEAADLFAGAAAVSFPLSGGSSFSAIVANCTPSRPIPVIHFHGTSDSVVSYESGVLDGLGARDSLRAWSQIQQCSTTTTSRTPTSGTTCLTHSNCEGTNVQVSLCTVQGGSHALYPNVNAPGLASIAWDFFKSFLPPQ